MNPYVFCSACFSVQSTDVIETKKEDKEDDVGYQNVTSGDSEKSCEKVALLHERKEGLDLKCVNNLSHDSVSISSVGASRIFQDHSSTDRSHPSNYSGLGTTINSRVDSIFRNQSLKMEKGEHCKIHINDEWLPGRIMNCKLDKIVDIVYVDNSEIFSKRLSWAAAKKKLEAPNTLIHGTCSLSELDVKSRLERFRENNPVCADCTGVPEWGEILHGVTLCSKCCGVHRKLGTHISKVRGLTLDNWTEDMYRSLRGNMTVNQELEHLVPPGVRKPHNKSSDELREEYIKAKYEKKQFKDTQDAKSTPAIYDAPSPKQEASSSRCLSAKAQVQYDGILTICRIEARDLPARGSPNPYCVFRNGYQEGRTNVCESTKYPKFNSVEPVRICVQEREAVFIHVFDSCRLRKDILLCSTQFNVQKKLGFEKDKNYVLPLNLTAQFKAKYDKKKKRKAPVICFRVTYLRLVS